MNDTFQALMLTRDDAGHTHAGLRRLDESALPAGEVLVDVAWSGLNYKDALAVTGRGAVVRAFPMVPGIDLAGTVRASATARHAPGDPVFATGWGIGEAHWGGFSERQRLPSEWLLPLPQGLDLREVMALGTAGLTAMLCVMTLEEAGLVPGRGPVLVTGASGGVGSLAVALLAGLGHAVSALTGSPRAADWLRGLGAGEIIPRAEMACPPRPLERQRWAGVVDTVGGVILARALAETMRGGAVAACGLAGGAELPATVMPFILRGVSLRGVDSVMCPVERRRTVWRRLATELPRVVLRQVVEDEITLAEVPARAETLLAGGVRGRLLVRPGG